MTVFTPRLIGAALAGALLFAAAMPAEARKPATAVALAEHGNFYIGGRDVERDGSMVRVQSMYVEYMIPARRTRKTPIVLIHGNYQSGAGFLTTPDGRAGWAEQFLRAGYAVYVVDQPMRGRSPYHPGTDGPASVMTAAQLERLFTAPGPTSSAPQTKQHTQWPGTGRSGDPVFEQFRAAQQPTVQRPGDKIDAIVRSAVNALLQKIGPAVVLTHSRAGTFGWEAADDAPELVKAVIAIEPNGPPFFNPPGADGKEPGARARPWGVTYDHLTFDPPVSSPDDIRIAREEKADGPDLLPCWLQTGEPRKLPHVARVPVLIVVGEASYHAPYDHCTARFLEQAGVPVTFMRLEDEGIRGNGHMMMLERNSDAIAAQLVAWLNKSVR
jgi:pimeloyl-ACP methyl ester carboxylesterase